MIANETEFSQSLDALCQMYKVLAKLRATHPDASPQWIAVLSEGFRDQAEQLREEIEAYIASCLGLPEDGSASDPSPEDSAMQAG